MKKRIIVDIGSSAYPLQAYGVGDDNAEVYLFEPRDDFYKELEDEFGHKENFHLNQLALSDSIGTATFYATQKRNCSSLLEPNDKNELISREARGGDFLNYETYDVKVDTLDNFLGHLERVDYMKIDTQGNEYQILKAGTELLKRTKFLKVEVHTTEFYKGQKLKNDFYELLEPLGFKFSGQTVGPNVQFEDLFFENTRELNHVI